MLFVGAVYGLANAMVVLKVRHLVQPVADFIARITRLKLVSDLVRCVPCMAFWIALAGSFFVFSPASQVLEEKWAATLTDGFFACGVTWLIHVTAERLGYKIESL